MENLFVPPDYSKIIVRWAQAADNLPRWHAIAEWLALESIRCDIAGFPEMAQPMRVLSDLAMQHARDLQPDREIELA
jgi:hypothetical protein